LNLPNFIQWWQFLRKGILMSIEKWERITLLLSGICVFLVLTDWWTLSSKDDPEHFWGYLLPIMIVVLILLAGLCVLHILRMKESRLWVEKNSELERLAAMHNQELHDKNTQLQGVLEDIQHMAYYDALTNLPNRRLFMHQMNQAMSRAKNHGYMLAVLFLDIDSFKLINDTMGHNFGDEVLQRVGEIIRAGIRDIDIVSRQGGDEFTILLDQIHTIEEGRLLIDQIHQSVQEPFTINDHVIRVHASTGIALYPRHGDDIENLTRYADIAMYKAKELGKNQYVLYNAEMNKNFVRRLSLEKELRSAIYNEELSLYFQPQVNISTGEIIGIESLVRWHNPVLGKVSPAELIPIAEKNGQIIAIGEWVLFNSCKQLKSWQADGYQISKIGVNISPVQFNDEKLVDTVKRILRETGLAPHYLELEITESVALYNEEAAFHKLQLLKDIGVKVALDDFGSGYSSLVYLFQFPFDTLKIDRSFMKNIMDNANNRILVETIITMAHGFNFNVIAEGVDTMEQYHFLKEKQCNEIQGFLISEPVHGEALLRLVEKYQTSLLPLKAIS